MTAIDFPNSPAVNDTFTVGDITWEWTGIVWQGNSVGAPGPAGADGTNGADGTDGTNGAAGADGTNGAAGADGTNGTNGINGGITIDVTSPNGGVYIINGATNPTLSFIRGHKYVINVSAPGHPFWIQTVSGAYSAGNIYNTGVTNNGAENGTIIVEVAFNAPQLYYACQYHSSMQGSIIVSDLGPAGADGEENFSSFLLMGA